MNFLALALALSLAAVGGACLYLSSPNQRWRATPLPPKPARGVAALLSLTSLYAFTRALDGISAVYTFGTWVMLLLVILPYLGAASFRPHGGAR